MQSNLIVFVVITLIAASYCQNGDPIVYSNYYCSVLTNINSTYPLQLLFYIDIPHAKYIKHPFYLN